MDNVSESEDEESEDDEVDVDSGPSAQPQDVDSVLQSPDLFALASQTVPRVIKAPSWQTAQTMDTPAYADLLFGMTAAGGPLSPDLVARLMPRGRDHIKNVQDDVRDLARTRVTGDDIFWINGAPEVLRVYKKPNMGAKRRAEWIVWKAEKLGVTLTPASFMAFF